MDFNRDQVVFDSPETDSKLGILAYLVVVPRAVEIPGCFLRFVPEVVVGGRFGGMRVFTFSGMACQAVGVCAQDVVTEVR